jgi:hypothetical protein
MGVHGVLYPPYADAVLEDSVTFFSSVLCCRSQMCPPEPQQSVMMAASDTLALEGHLGF